jgi:hypothetical protein
MNSYYIVMDNRHIYKQILYLHKISDQRYLVGSR